MIKYREIGVDLGSNEIKIALVDKTGTSPNSVAPILRELKAHEVYKVNCKPYTKDYYQLLKASIKSFCKKHKLKRVSLNISMPVDSINTHASLLSMPTVEDKLINEGVRFEAEQKMAEKGMSDSHYTWKIVDQDSDLNQSEILIATLRKSIIDALRQFKTIKWKVNRVMLQPVLLERVSQENDIVIDLGHQSTRMYLYKEGKISGIEIINIGGKDLIKIVDNYLRSQMIEDVVSSEIIKDIAVYSDKLKSMSHLHVRTEEEDWYNIDEEESSEDVKHSEDVKQEQSLLDILSLEIDDKVRELIDEIKRIMRMFELKSGFNIDNIYYIGQLSNLSYLKETIESELDSSLTPVDILDINNETEENLTLYSMASLVSMDTELKDNTNFSKLIKANVDYTSLIVILLTMSLSIGATFNLIGNSYDDKIFEVNEILSAQNQTIASVESDIAEVEYELTENSRFISKIEDLKNQKNWLSDFLYVVPEKTPLTIAIKHMNIKNERVVLEGYAGDYSSIGFFVKKLEEIATVEINTIDEYEENDKFSVTMDNPELISNKYKIKHKFKLTLTRNGSFLEH